MITIKVKFFALLKEIFGEEQPLHFSSPVSCAEVLSLLKERAEAAAPFLNKSLVAVNGQYAHPGMMLRANDELALLPPVSGG